MKSGQNYPEPAWARLVSLFCHPFLTIPLFVAIMMFAFNDVRKAAFVSLVIIGGIFVPLAISMYLKSRNGTYTNFDVSDRMQRNTLFYFAVPLLIIACIILYATGQPRRIWMSAGFGLILVFVSQIVNHYIKSSLHVSLNIFLSFLVLPVNIFAGILLLILTILTGWSRIVLKRHTLREVITGAVIGLAVSLPMFLIG